MGWGVGFHLYIEPILGSFQKDGADHSTTTTVGILVGGHKLGWERTLGTHWDGHTGNDIAAWTWTHRRQIYWKARDDLMYIGGNQKETTPSLGWLTHSLSLSQLRW